MTSLPEKLSRGDHSITYRPRRDDPQGELQEALARNYVHILFKDTSGGTELGFEIDQTQSDISGADWEAGEGSIHLEGNLELDGVPVTCIADLDIKSNSGTGHLVIRDKG